MLADGESQHRALWSGKEKIKDHTCLWDQFLSDTGPFYSQLIVVTLFLWPCLTARVGGIGYERKKWFIQWPLYLCLSLPFCPPNIPFTWNPSSREIARRSIPSVHPIQRLISEWYSLVNISGQGVALLGLELSELKIQVNSLPYSNIIIKLVQNNCANHYPLEEGRMGDKWER